MGNRQTDIKYSERYMAAIKKVHDDAVCAKNADGRSALKEDFGKLGLYTSAVYFMRIMHEIRDADEVAGLQAAVMDMAVVCLLTISWYESIPCDEIVSAQIELFVVKNKRYGSSFHECFVKDGYPYAFGHLQEKINRICSLLTLNEKANEEPLTDSLRDLLGYCVLTLIELG